MYMISIKKLMAAYSREDREPFKRIFQNALEISHDKWISDVAEAPHDYEPRESYIARGEYGNCILIVFDSVYDKSLYLQWTYQYKGSLLTKYYIVKETMFKSRY